MDWEEGMLSHRLARVQVGGQICSSNFDVSLEQNSLEEATLKRAFMVKKKKGFCGITM